MEFTKWSRTPHDYNCGIAARVENTLAIRELHSAHELGFRDGLPNVYREEWRTGKRIARSRRRFRHSVRRYSTLSESVSTVRIGRLVNTLCYIYVHGGNRANNLLSARALVVLVAQFVVRIQYYVNTRLFA